VLSPGPRSRAGAGAALGAALSVLLASCAAGGGPDASSPDASSPDASSAGAGSSSAGTTAPTATQSRPGHPVTTVVITDDPAVGSAAEGSWPGELAALAAGSGTPLDLDVAADADAGYVAGAGGGSFADLVSAEVGPATQLVLFAGSASGAAIPVDVQLGAAAAFAAVEAAAPDALIVVVAPWQVAVGGPAPDPDVQAAVRTAADGAEVPVTLVDPGAAGWSAAGSQQAFAQLLYPEVAPLVDALAHSGAFE